MRISEMQHLIARDQVREGLLRTSPEGWEVALEDLEGKQLPLTDSTGRIKHFHSLDHATQVLNTIGVKTISVLERF